MKTKKIITVAIIFALIFTILPFISAAASTEDVVIKVLVEPSLDFDYVRNFSEGLAAVCKDDKWGYINKAGKIVIPFEYEWVDNFKDGIAIVRTAKLLKGSYSYSCGVIDRVGKYIIPLEYDYLLRLYEGLFEASKSDKIGIIDATGKVIIPFEYERMKTYYFDDNTTAAFSEGLAVVQKGSKWGYINKANKVVIPFMYDEATHFGEGLAAVSIYGESSYSGYIDKTGKVLIKCKGYTAVEPFSDGLALVRGKMNAVGENGEFGYIDKTGEFIIPFEIYNDAGSFKNGIASVRNNSNGMPHYIDKTGKQAEPPLNYSADGLAIMVKGISPGSWYDEYTYGVVDKMGKYVIPMEYDNINPFYDGVTVARKDGKNYMISKTGKIIKIFDYDYVSGFSEGLAFVANGEFSPYGFRKSDIPTKWGIIQILRIGYPIGDVLYSDITAYINGYAIPTSSTHGKTMVVVEDLARYGFNVVWNDSDRALKVELSKNKESKPLNVVKNTVNKPGTFKCNYLYTDIKTYLSGEVVESYSIDGVTLIDFELLAKYGKLSWNGQTRELRLVIE